TGGFTAGSRVPCPRCGKAITLRAEDLRAAAIAAAPAPAAQRRPLAPRAGGDSRSESPTVPPWAIPVGITIVSALLLIVGGIILALHFAAKPTQQAVGPPPPAPPITPPADRPAEPADPGVGRT